MPPKSMKSQMQGGSSLLRSATRQNASQGKLDRSSEDNQIDRVDHTPDFQLLLLQQQEILTEQRKTNERLDLQLGELTRRLDQALAGNIQLEKKVKEMEAVLQDLQSQSRPTGDILNRSTVSAAADVQRQVAAAVAEELDRTSRQSNIILRGIPEEDQEDLPALCTRILGLTSSEQISVNRVGGTRPRSNVSKPDTTPHTASGNVPRPVPSAARTSPRPIRVRMLSQTVKSDVYRRCFNMKHGDAAVYISHDLTRSQQAQRSKAVPLYKRLRQKSVLCSLPYDTILNQEGEPITTDKITALLGD